MPVRKVGPNSYQWGNSGKVYSGKGAKAKAERQGRAIYASGYKGAAEEYGAESYKPPASAIANAKRGLRLRKEWGRGGLSPSEAKSQGIDSGVTRARKIASGKVSRHDVRRMSAFNRHRKNYRPDKKMSDGGPTAGTIAWLLWGGTSGVNWAKKKSAAMNAETFEAMAMEDGIIVCDSCNNDVESDRQYGTLTITCNNCGNTLYEDDSYDKFDMMDFYGAEDWSGDSDGPLAKALAKARESLKKSQKPLQITKLPHPNQKSLKDYEADWQDLPRNELGQWQKPVSTEQLQNLIATTPGVPKLSDLLMLYGGDTPTNRYRLYNDMLTLRITTEDFDDDTIVIDIDNDPEIYYQYILEEPLDIEEEDERLTPEYWDRYSRYLAMTNTPDELEARIESLVSDLDLFNDSDFSEIGVMMAALRQQKFMEKYQAE
jgi:predicted RNA-binding Zn-ribbon protein involved in translation (DUF1610 family)